MALWYTEPATFASTSGGDINATVALITIKPQVNEDAPWSGVYLDKSNFKIGNGTETSTGSNIWNTGSGTWNADAGITQVEFVNLGPEGYSNNWVQAKVTFGSVSPTVDTTFYIDIDEKDDNPVAEVLGRNVCFFVDVPHDTRYIHEFYTPESNETDGWTLQTSIAGGGITKTLINDPTNIYHNPGYYRYRYSGTINDYQPDALYNLSRILLRRAYLGNTIDPLPGVGDPDYSTHDFYFWWADTNVAVGSQYSIYNQMYQPEWAHYGVPGVFQQTYALHLDVQINPIDIDVIIEQENGYFASDQHGMCTLGHVMQWYTKVYDPPNIFDEPGGASGITTVDIPYDLGESPGYRNIVVRGGKGAQYNLVAYKTASVDSDQPAASNAYYSFVGVGGFVNNKPNHEFEIGSNNKNIHRILIPKSTTDVNYKVYVESLNDTILKDTIPTFQSKKTISKKSPYTISMSCVAAIPSYWGTLPTFSFTTRPKEAAYESRAEHVSTTATVNGAVSSSSTIKLTEANKKIQEGMYVIKPMETGVPHLTKVSHVDNNIITTSAAVTLSDGDILHFESNTSNIQPFSLLVPANNRNLSIQTGTSYRPKSAIGNLQERGRVTILAPCSGVNQIPCNNEDIPTIGKLAPGMIGRSVGLSSISSGKNFITIDSIKGNASNGITTVETFTGSENAVVIFEEDKSLATPTVVKGLTNLHTQADMTVDGSSSGGATEKATISGYFSVGAVSNPVAIKVYIDNLIDSDPW